jgi:hypothetical protein
MLIKMSEKRTAFIGLIRDHRTKIGRIKAIRGDLTGCKSENKTE